MNIVKAILATIIYIIVIELLGSWFYLAKIIKFDNYLDYYIIIQGIVQLAAVFLYLYFLRRKTLNFKPFIKRTHYKWYLIAIVLGSTFVFIQTPLNLVYNYIFDDIQSINYNFDGIKKFKNINILSIVLFLPIGEELFFRGYIQKNLEIKINSITAIITASLLFAFIHYPRYKIMEFTYNIGDMHLSYITLFGGLLSGLLFRKTKSIGPSILFHICWNIMAITV